MESSSVNEHCDSVIDNMLIILYYLYELHGTEIYVVSFVPYEDTFVSLGDIYYFSVLKFLGFEVIYFARRGTAPPSDLDYLSSARFTRFRTSPFSCTSSTQNLSHSLSGQFW